MIWPRMARPAQIAKLAIVGLARGRRDQRLQLAGHQAREEQPLPPRRGAVPDALLGLPHAVAGRRRGLGDLGPGPPAHAGAELRLPPGVRGDRALRDPQRRLLRPDHARRTSSSAATRWRSREFLAPLRRLRGAEDADARPERHLLQSSLTRAGGCAARPPADQGPARAGARGARAARPGARRRARRGDRARRPPPRDPAGARVAAGGAAHAPPMRSPRPAAPARTRARRSRACARRGERERELERELGDVEAELQRALLALPNLPAPDAADERHGRCGRSASRAGARPPTTSSSPGR